MLVEDGKKAKRRKFLFAFWILIFFMIVSVAIYIRSPFATVKVVTVSGAVNISPEMIERDAAIFVGQNLFQVPVAEAEQRLLEDFPILKNVRIYRDFVKQAVEIHVSEKVLAGILSANGSFFRVLSDGTVLDRDPTGIGVNDPILSTSFPVKVSLGQRLENPMILSVCSQLPDLPLGDVAEVSELHIESYQGTYDILAFARDGFEIRMPVDDIVGSFRLYDAIHRNLLAMHVAPGLVDLFNSRQGVYKPYSSAS